MASEHEPRCRPIAFQVMRARPPSSPLGGIMRRSTRVIGAIATIAFFSACGSDQIVATGSKGALPDVPVSGEKLASTLWQQTARDLVRQPLLSLPAPGPGYPLFTLVQQSAVL